jgi:hypothetical protein
MKLLLTIILAVVFVCCGPSNEEIALQNQRTKDSINKVIEIEKLKAAEQERLKIEEELKAQQERESLEKQKADEEKINNPLTYLTFKLEKDIRILKDDRLTVVVINTHKTKRIADVKFRVYAYAKTGTELGSHDEIIYDFAKPSEPYNRMIDFNKFPAGSDMYNTKFLNAVFK